MWKVYCPSGCRGHIIYVLSIYDTVFTINLSKQACILRLTVTCENDYVVEGSFRRLREPAGRKWHETEMTILFIQNISAIMSND